MLVKIHTQIDSIVDRVFDDNSLEALKCWKLLMLLSNDVEISVNQEIVCVQDNLYR
jgi:hypothetical protein